MGKKGGKKGSALSANADNSEANLPAIPEEVQSDRNEGSIEGQRDGEQRKLRSSKKSLKSDISILRTKSILKSSNRSLDRLYDSDKTKSIILEEFRDTLGSMPIPVSFEETKESEEEKRKKGKKGKKGNKGKWEPPAAGDDEDVEKQNKEKKRKPGGKEKKPKKGKKEKKESEEEGYQEIQLKPSAEEKRSKRESRASTGVEVKQEQKQGKKEKKEKAEQTEETGKKKGKGKKEKATKETQKDFDKEPRELKSSDSKIGPQSRVSFHQSTAVLEVASRLTMEDEQATGGMRDGSRGSMDLEPRERFMSASRTKYHRKSSIRHIDSSISATAHGRKLRRGTSASRLSNDTDISSESSVESARFVKEERARKKPGKAEKRKKTEKREKPEKKVKKQKKEDQAEPVDKAAQKGEKKAAKKAKKQDAAATTKKGETKEKEYEETKKALEELKRIAKEMGIDDLMVEEGDDRGPKKKISKKEKARLTAEVAEKQRVEMEAQAKRLEEIVRKKKEEERLAAIERDKRDTFEQGMRVEQLKTSNMLIEDIIDVTTELLRQEKDLLEWTKYVECGELPNPIMCDQMSTYLHLWELGLEQTSVEVASKMTKDVIKLLADLDELIDAATEKDEGKLDNWKWIRQLFRNYQASSLDVATYRLMRDVEHNLNRINIPTADFNFRDDYVTLCLWLRVMLPIPLPNPRRPPKPRIDISFNLMNMSVLFPITIDCQDAAIRAMYLIYDHYSDLCETFTMPEVPEDYHMDLLTISKKEWRLKLKYKYDNRDKKQIKPAPVQEQNGLSPENLENSEHKPDEKSEADKKAEVEDPDDIASDEEIPLVPFKQLKPTAHEFAVETEDQMYNDTRRKLLITVPEHIINLRKFVILGGVYHLHLLAQPPQPQDFITMEMTITGLHLPKRLEVLPFKVVYTPYIPPEPETPTGSEGSLTRKLPEELEEEIKKQEEELDKLIAINIKWPQHVIFLELPIVCRWDEEKNQWSKEEIHDLKHNEEKCILSFRTGVFGIYGLAAYRYSNLPFQAYDIKPELDGSLTVQLTAAILMLEFNISHGGLISITQLQNSPNATLQDVVGKYYKLHQLKRMMKEGGIDIFPSFDAFCYVQGCCEKQWAMEKHLYYNMAQMSNSFNFAWSRWNLQAGRRRIILQMRQYSPESKKQKSHQMLLVTPLKAAFIECTEVSQTFSDKEMDSQKFCSDLYHLMKSTSGIFVRNKIMKTCKQNVNVLAQFLAATRILSFS